MWPLAEYRVTVTDVSVSPGITRFVFVYYAADSAHAMVTMQRSLRPPPYFAVTVTRRRLSPE
jgi:hypothetical protein